MTLTPFPDGPSDVNRDGCVKFDDYDEILHHLSNGSECPPNVICIWDVDGDYDVDTADATAVALAECQDEAEPPPCCQGCPWYLLGMSQQERLAEHIDIVLESNNSTEVKAELTAQLLDLFG